MSARYSRLLSTGSFLPANVVTNADLADRIDTSDQWIRERTGIRQRHIAVDGETTADLASAAADVAIRRAGIDPKSIDMIIVATTTADHVFPSVATQVQERIGNFGAPAFDVQAVCAGFAYALSVADRFIRTGGAHRALVIGAETFSRILDWEDRSTCVLFGDGAGAVLLDAADEPGILSTHLHADGRYRELLWVPAGISTGYERTRQNAAFVSMQGSDVFKFAVRTLANLVEETLAANELDTSELDWLVPHQANERILTATAKKLGLAADRVVCTVAEHANTSAASVPLALDCAISDGRIERGHLVLLEAFGGGFTWGSALLRY